MDFNFHLVNPILLFALLIILLVCGFQESLFDMSVPRCIATGGDCPECSSCIVYDLSMGNYFNLVICIILCLEGLKVISQNCSQSISLSMSCCKLSWSGCLLIFR